MMKRLVKHYGTCLILLNNFLASESRLVDLHFASCNFGGRLLRSYFYLCCATEVVIGIFSLWFTFAPDG